MAEKATDTKPTLDQRRAKHAWEAIEAISSDKNAAEEYAREAKKLPMRILTAGLGQALSFIDAKAHKKKKSLGQLHEDLSDWVIRKRPLPTASNRDLLRSIIEGDSVFLRRATDETLAYLQWLTRFAEARGLVGGED